MAVGASVGSDDRAVTSEMLRALRALGPVDMAFAARVDDRTASFVLDRFDGAQTNQLRNLVSPFGTGVGGKCIALGRPVFVTEYTAARGITHQFDRQVSGEGLRALFAIPIAGEGGVREVVYGAARRPLSFGERLIERAVDIVDRSARESRATQQMHAEQAGKAIREVRAALQAIAGEMIDPSLRRRLYEVIERLPHQPEHIAGRPTVKVSRRELDVLTEVAMGYGNGRVAVRLGLTEQTVKSYLKSAMAKLDSHTRGEAVYRARSVGLLP